MKLALLLAAALWAQISIAGHVTGNGGDAVVCRNSAHQITSIELLDFYEGRAERGMAHNLNPAQTVDENLDLFLQRMTTHDAQLPAVLGGWRSGFFSEAVMLSGVTLVDVPDSDHITFPNGCAVEQIAVQKKPEFPGDKRYTINKDLWDAMDNVNRAGLVLHELLYRQVIAEPRFKDIDSKAVRFLNSVLAAGRMDVFTFQTYLTFLKDQLYVSHVVVGGYPAHLPSLQFDEQGRVTKFNSYFAGDLNPVQVGGLTFTLRGGASLSYSADHATGVKTLNLGLAQGHQTFPLNGFDFFAEAVEVDLNGSGVIVNLRGASFKWQSFDWPAMRDLKCGQIAVSTLPAGGIVCQEIDLDFGRGFVFESPIRYSEVAFDSNRRVLWAKAIHGSPSKSLEIQFSSATGFFQRIQCTGQSWSFHYGAAPVQELMCVPGTDILFFANGQVQSGGYQSRYVKLSTGQALGLEYSEPCGDDGVGRRPAYRGHQNGRPANGVVAKITDGPVLAERPDGAVVKLFGMEYIELDENGAVTLMQPGYCSN